MPICQLKINETALTSTQPVGMLRLEGGKEISWFKKAFSHFFIFSLFFFLLLQLYTNTQVEKYFVVVDVVVQTCAVWGVLIGRQSLLQYGLPSGGYFFVPIIFIFFFVLVLSGTERQQSLF